MEDILATLYSVACGIAIAAPALLLFHFAPDYAGRNALVPRIFWACFLAFLLFSILFALGVAIVAALEG